MSEFRNVPPGAASSAFGSISHSPAAPQSPAQTSTSSPGPMAGSPLPPTLRYALEVQHGVNLSDVRVHQSMAAVHTSALAFSQGNDIHIMPGAYDPYSPAGRQLIGHEVAHVVQQRAPVPFPNVAQPGPQRVVTAIPGLGMASSIPQSLGDEAGTSGGHR